MAEQSGNYNGTKPLQPALIPTPSVYETFKKQNLSTTNLTIKPQTSVEKTYFNPYSSLYSNSPKYEYLKTNNEKTPRQAKEESTHSGWKESDLSAKYLRLVRDASTPPTYTPSFAFSGR